MAKELLNFLRHPRDFAGFATAFKRGCGPHWPAILDATDSGHRNQANIREGVTTFEEVVRVTGL